MASNITDKCGHDYKYVKEPPDDLTCLICRFVAKDPQQVTCCGRIYCRACLEEQKKHSRVCPQCRGRGQSFEDKRSDRAIKRLKVKCNNDKNGCEWSGEMSQQHSHLQECKYQLVQCPNECTALMYRYQVYTHCKNFCPCERVKCKYFHIGCTTELLRKDSESHESNDQLHLHLAIETISKMQSQNAFTFRMADFEYYKSKNESFYSPSFYSEPGGYKLCLNVIAKGDGDEYDKSVSVYVYFMRGKNDHNLVWPFRGRVKVELLNQLQDDHHHKVELQYTKDKDNDSNNRVTDPDKDIADSGYGFSSFIPHSDLGDKPDLNRCQYLEDDCLFFRVTVEAPEPIKPWLTCSN